jgi:hypothetical protein
MGDAFLTILLLVFVLSIPSLWFFIIRKIVRGRRAAREVRALGATLTEDQAKEFDRSLLPQTRDIFEQLELMIEYVREINEEVATERAAESDSEANMVIPPGNVEASEEDSVVQQLERLASLFQQDLLTEAEYTRLKSQLIDE